MARIVVDVDDALLSFAQRQLGTQTTRETINRALAIVARSSPEDRARGLAWLHEHAEEVMRGEEPRRPAPHPEESPSRFRVLRSFEGPATDLSARAKDVARAEIDEDGAGRGRT